MPEATPDAGREAFVRGYLAAWADLDRTGMVHAQLLLDDAEGAAERAYRGDDWLSAAIAERDAESAEAHCRASRIPKPIRRGTVYVLHDPTGWRYKIGFTSGPVEKRRRAIEGATGLRLILLVAFAGSTADEATLLERFAEWRTRGEWFADSPAIRDWIAMVAP